MLYMSECSAQRWVHQAGLVHFWIVYVRSSSWPYSLVSVSTLLLVVCEGEARFDDQEDEEVVVDGEAPQARRQRQQQLREELGPLFFLEGPRLCVERGRRLQGGASLPGAIELLDSVKSFTS